jgi:ABC-type dipeptide/oligopeptide/nickel transport system permease subunit
MRRLQTLRTILLWQWSLLLLAMLFLGTFTHQTRAYLPLGIEKEAENLRTYGGWVPRAHPLGVVQTDDRLELLLLALRRSLAGPLLGCLIAVGVGGLWGAWAAYKEGALDQILTSCALFLDAIPRIALFALILRLTRNSGLHLDLLRLVVAFALFQIPAVALALRNQIRSIVREGYVEGLVSLGFARRTIVLRDLLWRECSPLLRLQYVARVTELVALETAISYTFGGSEGTVGGLLKQQTTNSSTVGWFEFLLVGCLALYILTLTVLARRPWREPSAAARVRGSADWAGAA